MSVEMSEGVKDFLDMCPEYLKSEFVSKFYERIYEYVSSKPGDGYAFAKSTLSVLFYSRGITLEKQDFLKSEKIDSIEIIRIMSVMFHLMNIAEFSYEADTRTPLVEKILRRVFQLDTSKIDKRLFHYFVFGYIPELNDMDKSEELEFVQTLIVS